jgi:hypothetical protein
MVEVNMWNSLALEDWTEVTELRRPGVMFPAFAWSPSDRALTGSSYTACNCEVNWISYTC